LSEFTKLEKWLAGILAGTVTACVVSAISWWLDHNTTDAELRPVAASVDLHDDRIGVQENVSEQMTRSIDIMARQQAYSGVKFAAEDLRLLEKKGRENWDSADQRAYDLAIKRLEENQSVIDAEMGLRPPHD